MRVGDLHPFWSAIRAPTAQDRHKPHLERRNRKIQRLAGVGSSICPSHTPARSGAVLSYVARLVDPGLGVFWTTCLHVGSTSRRRRSCGLGGWTVAGPPEGSARHHCLARTQLAFEEGAGRSRQPALTGFGLEGLSPRNG